MLASPCCWDERRGPASLPAPPARQSKVLWGQGGLAAGGRRCRISDGAPRQSCGCCPRLMAGIGPRSLPSPCHPIRRAPTASSLAPWGPGTAHPALSRPLLRTLPCQRWHGMVVTPPTRCPLRSPEAGSTGPAVPDAADLNPGWCATMLSRLARQPDRPDAAHPPDRWGGPGQPGDCFGSCRAGGLPPARPSPARLGSSQADRRGP
jgi:hypothetical protein